MVEILFICLVVWIIYAWKTGKFSKEYQDKNNAEMKKEWIELKQDFKPKNNSIKLEQVSSPTLSQKQRKKSQEERIKEAEKLAEKLGTKSQIQDEKFRKQAQKDYEYTLKILGKSKTDTSLNYDDYSFSDSHDEPEFEISYNNPPSFRKIKIYELYSKKYDGEFFTYVDAYCFSAEDDRTFRIDRINHIEELNTGNFYFSTKDIKQILKKYAN